MPIANYINTETKEIVEHFTQGKLPDSITIDGVEHVRDYSSGSIGFKFVGSGFYETDYKHK